MLSMASTEAKFYFFIYKTRAVVLIKDEVTGKKKTKKNKKHTLQNHYSPMILLGISRTDDQIGKKRYLQQWQLFGRHHLLCLQQPLRM